MWSFVQDCVFPQSCSGCGVSDEFFCARCRAQATDITQPSGVYLPSSNPAISTIIALTKYQPHSISGTLIEALKYTYSPDAQTVITQWLQAGQEIIKNLPPADMVIPIPLHPRRLAERGFNQADIIAHEVATILQIPLATKVLTRNKNTKQQATLSKQERMRNMVSAFTVIDSKPVIGKTCIVVDDVYTTGSTMGQAAETLIKSGVKQVIGFTLARAHHPT